LATVQPGLQLPYRIDMVNRPVEFSLIRHMLRYTAK
jgi:hypothetical protein